MKVIFVDANILDKASQGKQNRVLEEMRINPTIKIRNILNDFGLVFLYNRRTKPKPISEILELRRV